MTIREPLAGVRIWDFELDLPEAEAAAMARVLASEEAARAARFVLPRDRVRFAVGRARLRTILGGILGGAPEAIVFAYGPRGKPSLAPPWDTAGVRFSLSHSAGRAMLAVADGREIGCDLEAHRELPHGRAIARRFLSETENEHLGGLEGEAWTAAFFRCWTRKEAYVKALGEGLAYPTRRFTVTLREGEPARLSSVEGDPEAPSRWRLEAIEAARGFEAAICVARR